jgi:integrase/recombinase XerD
MSAPRDRARADAPIIERFADALWMEAGLSENTLSAYRSDLDAYARWLTRRKLGLEHAGRGELLGYLAECVGRGARPRTTARLLSSLRRFYRYLLREGVIKTDPSAEVDSPKLGRPLPKSLTEEQVEKLLQAPDTKKNLGLRDRAMLETLYASGLRVSELVGLKMSQVNLTSGVLRVVGKGNKERLVPLGEEALSWLSTYLSQARGALLGAHTSDALFVTARGASMTRQARAPRRHRDGALAAHVAPRLRHPSAQSRRRPARGADAARPRRPFHHPDLHPGGARTPEESARASSPARLIYV